MTITIYFMNRLGHVITARDERPSDQPCSIPCAAECAAMFQELCTHAAEFYPGYRPAQLKFSGNKVTWTTRCNRN